MLPTVVNRPKNITALGKIMRKVPPLTTGSHQESYGVDDASSANLFRTFFLLRDEFFDDLPLLLVGQVCVIMGFHSHVTPFVIKV